MQPHDPRAIVNAYLAAYNSFDLERMFGVLADTVRFENYSGDELTAHFNIQGREYNGRWFNNLSAWKIECDSKRPANEEKPPPASDKDVPADFEEFEDDIPF